VIKIELSPEVERALSAAFPVPKNAARRALSKYVQVLEQLLTQAMMYGRTPEQVKLNTYSISLHRLANEGGQIGPKRQRVHAWLREKGLELVRTVTQGSNLNGIVSTVKLTDWTMLIPETSDLPSKEERTISIHRASNQALNSAERASSQEVDWLDVDIKSLNAYMQWVAEQSTLISKEEKQRILLQAGSIHAEASSNGGRYAQIKKPSVFGRMYYEGLSIQNVNKELRRAVLGDCWEYDIRSSVIAWKMGFAKECLASLGSLQSIRQFKEIQHPKKIKPWWWTSVDGRTCLTVRYGVKTLELVNGRNAVETDGIDGVISTLEVVQKAAQAGELDLQIEALVSKSLDAPKPARHTLSLRKPA